MNESRCYVDSAVLAEHQPFNRNGKALRCDYPKRALYHILLTLYAFNRSARQRFLFLDIFCDDFFYIRIQNMYRKTNFDFSLFFVSLK